MMNPMKKTTAETILAEAGISESQIAAILAGIRDIYGEFACLSPQELWMEDTKTGAIRFPAQARHYYQRRFARAGLVLEQHLSSKHDFSQAYRTVLDHEREVLCQEDAARVSRMKPGDPRRAIAKAFHVGNLSEIKRQLSFFSRRSSLKAL